MENIIGRVRVSVFPVKPNKLIELIHPAIYVCGVWVGIGIGHGGPKEAVLVNMVQNVKTGKSGCARVLPSDTSFLNLVVVPPSHPGPICAAQVVKKKTVIYPVGDDNS